MMSISINDLGEQELDQHHVLSFLMECSPDTGDMLCLFSKEQHDTKNVGTSTSVPSWEVFQKMIFPFRGWDGIPRKAVGQSGWNDFTSPADNFLFLKVPSVGPSAIIGHWSCHPSSADATPSPLKFDLGHITLKDDME